METVVVAVMAAVILAGGCRLLLTIGEKEKRKRMNRLLHHFSELGSSHNLTFSSQEILHDCIIGMDGVQRKLLVSNYTGEEISHTELVDLSGVKSCSVKKQYGHIRGGELREKKLETYLEFIVLHFEQEGAPPVEIPFYQHRLNPISEVPKLEKKARHWETMLSKMIHIPVKKIA